MKVIYNGYELMGTGDKGQGTGEKEYRISNIEYRISDILPHSPVFAKWVTHVKN